MTDLIVVNCNDKTPESVVREQSNKLEASGGLCTHLLIHYPFQQYWVDKQPQCQLSAFIKLQRQAESVQIQFTVTDRPDNISSYYSMNDVNEIEFSDVCQQLSLPHFYIDQPIVLSSVCIPKPWGQEVWFTGIEERGVSMASQNGMHLPLPWVLSVFPGALSAGRHQSLILLKILDPLPDAILGDLYFELHQKKQEVYVVTAVDERAWPSGEGEIRFGIDQSKREQYPTDTQFREAFIEAVATYEAVRRQIDGQLDAMPATQSTDNESGAAPISKAMKNVPESLRLKEERLRKNMETFTGRRKLRIGDVVKVPCLTPHSLQHGVRTVEFQTPVYERLIVSFAQKVLTQSHWDTKQAVDLMTLENDKEEDTHRLFNQDGVLIERIVDFDDFDVKRVVLDKGATWYLDTPQLYSLLMGVEGEVLIGAVVVIPEQAILLPSCWFGEQISNKNDTAISFLLANPK